MVPKTRGTRQQDTSRPAQDGWLHSDRDQRQAFNAAVAQAVEDADPDAVHRVRTGSRRLQAMLEATLREAGPAADALERPAEGGCAS